MYKIKTTQRFLFALLVFLLFQESSALEFAVRKAIIEPIPLFNAVAYGNGLYVAVGCDGVIATSTDAVSWTSRNSEVSVVIYDIAYAESRFVAVGRSAILSSTDGISWQKHAYGSSATCINVNFCNGKWIVIPINAGDILLTSSDASNWTTIQCDSIQNFKEIIYTDGTYLGVGTMNGRGFIRTSSDLLRWRTIKTASGWYGAIAAFKNRHIAVASYTKMLMSSDGLTWSRPEVTACKSNRATGADAIATDQAYAITIGSGGGMLSSNDGINWECDTLTIGNSELYGVTAGDGQFVAVGSGGTVVSIYTGSSGVAIPDRSHGSMQNSMYNALSGNLQHLSEYQLFRLNGRAIAIPRKRNAPHNRCVSRSSPGLYVVQYKTVEHQNGIRLTVK